MRKVNVAITGGSGFVGTNLILALSQLEDVNVWSLDTAPPQLDSLAQYHQRCDITIDHGVLYDAVAKADYIYHLAAQTSHPLSMVDPLNDNIFNVVATLKLINICRELPKPPLIVYPSSTSLYGPQNGYCDHATLPNPVDVYSANKLHSENLLRIYHHIGQVRVVIFRLPNCYGPFGNPDPKYGVANYFIHQASRGNDLTVYGNGKQVRNFLYIRDAVEALLIPVRWPNTWSYPHNVAHPKHYSVGEFAQTVSEVWGCKVRSVTWPDHRRKIEIGDCYLNTDGLFADFDWQPQFDLKQGLEQTYEDFNYWGLGASRQRYPAQSSV